MRSALILLLALAVGVGLSLLLLGNGGEEAPQPPPKTGDYERELAENPHLLVETGTLVVRARALDGSIPMGLEVGYYSGARTRFLNASDEGVRAFADAPLGTLLVAAKAPGYQEAQQTWRLTAGVPEEVILKLRPLD